MGIEEPCITWGYMWFGIVKPSKERGSRV